MSIQLSKQNIVNNCHSTCPNFVNLLQLLNKFCTLQAQITRLKQQLNKQKHKYTNMQNTQLYQQKNVIKLCQGEQSPLHPHKYTQVQQLKKKICSQIQNKSISCLNLLDYNNKELKEENFVINKNKIIADICIFGLSRDTIQKTLSNKCSVAEPQLIYSTNNLFDRQRYNQTAKYLFGDVIQIKRIKNQRMQYEINLILFQNHKKQSNFIYSFKSQELSFVNLTQKETQFLDNINPHRKLYCISIKFYEYTIFNHQLTHTNHKFNNTQITEAESQINLTLQQKKKLEAFSAKRILSIFTFYPFFQFFENLLLLIFNTIKIEKLDIYRSQQSKFNQVDGQYFIKRMDSEYRDILLNFNQNKLQYNHQYTFPFYDTKLNLNTQKQDLIQINHKLSLLPWVYTILKMFDRNTFYHTLCSIILEQQIVFVCQNTNILTYTIQLFSQILIRPFTYPHPCVYIVPQEQFLNAPTTIILGLNKSKDWLKQNEIIQNNDKIFIQLDQMVKIIRKKSEEKTIISKKLNEIINNFYKKFEKENSIFKKKREEDTYKYGPTIKQRQECLDFIKSINSFFKQQIMQKIPNTESLMSIRQRILLTKRSRDPATEISDEIIKQMVKNRKQDQLINKFLQTQIFLSQIFSKLNLQ